MYVEDKLESAGMSAHLKDEAKALLMARRAHEYLIDALRITFVVILFVRLLRQTDAQSISAEAASQIVFPIVLTQWPKVR